jgi:tetratricopeptide (TPR) repeat protein
MIWPFKSNPGARRIEGDVDTLLLRGAERERSGELGGAEESYRELLQLRPEDAAARHRLAHVLALQACGCQERGVFDAAIEGYEESLALDDRQAQVHNNLGNAYKSLGRQEDAVAAYRAAIAIDAGLAEAHLNLGTALYETGESAQAIAHCRTALVLKPAFAEASLRLGYLLEQEGDARGAMECYRNAIAARPDYAEAHFNHALQLLLAGDFEKGWKEYEWRLQLPDLASLWPHAGRTRWDGSPLDGKVILLYAEQGFGDAIQFVRYAPMVAERGGRVIVSCQPRLKSVLGSVPRVSRVLHWEEQLPPFDVSCSLLSLPLLFDTRVETIPAPLPYVRPDAAKAERWKKRLDAEKAALKVGLYWATESKIRISPLRSLTLDMLAPLGDVRGVTYYSLQRGAAAAQAARPPQGMKLIDLALELDDFSDDAALMANLDLVISIDTATAHLAGAIGRPVWTLTHFPPEWRWLLGREDSPWYPTMRLFRKGRGDSWQDVASRLAQCLRQIAGERGG